jgi:hypothetical protein
MGYTSRSVTSCKIKTKLENRAIRSFLGKLKIPNSKFQISEVNPVLKNLKVVSIIHSCSQIVETSNGDHNVTHFTIIAISLDFVITFLDLDFQEFSFVSDGAKVLKGGQDGIFLQFINFLEISVKN